MKHIPNRTDIPQPQHLACCALRTPKRRTPALQAWAVKQFVNFI